MKRNWNYRNHHQQRMQRRAERVLRDCWGYTQWFSDERIRNDAKRLANNLAICSCSMCRNPRRSGWLPQSEEPTVQERREVQISVEDYLP